MSKGVQKDYDLSDFFFNFVVCFEQTILQIFFCHIFIRVMAPEDSPYFFMREFSNEELSKLLVTKVEQLKKEKAQTEELNERLQQHLAELEELTCKLEETQEELKKERDNLENQVKLKTEQLLKTEKLTAVGELSARIAHDMRNPLSTIKNSLEIMKSNQKNMDPKTKMHWDRIDRALLGMSHQVNDVLDYVKVAPVSKKREKLSFLLKESVEKVTIPKNIKVTLPKNDVAIPCDSERIEVVFVNLIMNAIQAMEFKKGEIIISITEESPNVVLITVKDNGPGIPQTLIHKIFDPMFTTRQIGTGLGLPSCKNIIEKHNGSLDVASTVGKGTTFLIRLPTVKEWENISKIGAKEKLTEYITSIN